MTKLERGGVTAYHDNPEIEAFLAEIDEGGTIEAADLDALELGPQCFDLVVVELRGERERVEVGSLMVALIDLCEKRLDSRVVVVRGHSASF